MTKKKTSKAQTEDPIPDKTEEENKPESGGEQIDEAVKDKELESLKKELETQKDIYLRLAAEYDNFRKRTEKEKLLTYDNALSKTVEMFLPVADSLNLAVSAESGGIDEYRKGLEMIKNQMSEALKKLNVETFGETGDVFDPELHNAVAQINDDSLGEGRLSAVFQKGYKIGDKVIRHAMVQVANC